MVAEETANGGRISRGDRLVICHLRFKWNTAKTATRIELCAREFYNSLGYDITI